MAAFLLLLRTYVSVDTTAFGITKLIVIGHEFDERGLSTFQATPKYIGPSDRWGFDGQFYAEIALDPLLRDPQLSIALDNPPYRSRRILMSWLAWLGGLGKPFWVLNVYAALNLVFWIGFVVMLAVLFRPYGWVGLAGFAAMLMTCGIIESMRVSLTDFPGFVLMTLAMMIGGVGGTGVLALAVLTREPNILGLVGLWDYRPPWLPTFKRNLLFALIAGVPMALWFAYVISRFPLKESIDGGNLDWPLRGIMAKLGEFSVHAVNGDIRWGAWYSEFYTSEVFHALLTIISTLTQCIYLLTHREWNNRIWRVGAAFVPFFLCISFLPWESHFTITRHALPITLAFNLVLATRAHRTWPIWFFLGNCFVPYGIHLFVVECSRYPTALAESRIGSVAGVVRHGDGWFDRESDAHHRWIWAESHGGLEIVTWPRSAAIEARLTFRMCALTPRTVRVCADGREVWRGPIGTKLSTVNLPPLLVKQGHLELELTTDTAPALESTKPDARPLGFALYDPVLSMSARAPPLP
jgi:hypothetical protein